MRTYLEGVYGCELRVAVFEVGLVGGWVGSVQKFTANAEGSMKSLNPSEIRNGHC